MSLIGKVEPERVIEEKHPAGSGSDAWRYRRYLTATLTGDINRGGTFTVGARELPIEGLPAIRRGAL